MYSEIIELLAEGDKRTTRGVDEVVQRALATPAVMRSIVDCLEMDDEALAMRASDALQKVGAKRPTLLEPYRSDLIRICQYNPQKEVQWHMAQMLPCFVSPQPKPKR